MQYIFWEDHFDVGHQPFNEQHKEIFRLQNRVVNLLCGDAGPHELSAVLNALIRYCESHFKDEEGLMEQYGYGDLPSHQQEHERLVLQIFDMTEDLGREHFNRDRLLDFLNNWITDHIMKVDKKYSRFFSERITDEEHGAKRLQRQKEAAASGEPSKTAENPQPAEEKNQRN